MQTLTIDIIDEKALRLLHDLELLQLIRVRKELSVMSRPDRVQQHKGAMKKQPLADVDAQLQELRDGWE